MSNRHYSRKTSQGRKENQRSGEDEKREFGRKPNFGSSTDNRPEGAPDEEGRFPDNERSESHSSNFGDDEIGGTSFDPRPANSADKRRNGRNVKKEGTMPAHSDDRK